MRQRLVTSNINEAVLAQNDGSITLTDTFDSRLEYVEGSAKIYGGSNEYNIGTTYSSSVPTVTIEGNTATFTLTESALPGPWGQKDDGTWGELDELYPYYKLTYTMKVTNAAALTQEALQAAGMTVTMHNAVHSVVGDGETDVTYTPNILDKYESARDNNGKVQFTILVNSAQLDLDQDSDVIVLTDKLENISAQYQDIVITFPKGNYTSGQVTTKDGNGNTVDVPYFNMKGDTITFYLPDGVETMITYWSKPSGEVGADGKIHYKNTAELKGYKKEVSGTSDWHGSAEGTSTKYGVKLYKADGYVNSKMVGGAKFKLYIVDEVDKNYNIVSYTTMKNADGTDYIVTSSADGTIEISGDASEQGWNLKPEQRYFLLEVEAPAGYAVDNTKYQFVISSQGYVNYTKNPIVAPDGSGAIIEPWTFYNGDIVTVKDWPKDGELKLTKNFATGSDITKMSDLDDDQKSAVKFEVYSGTTVDGITTWKLLKTIGLDEFMTSEDGSSGTYTIGDLPAGQYKVIEVVDDTACTEKTYRVQNNGDAIVSGQADEIEYVTVDITEEDISSGTAHEVTISNKYEQESEFKIYKYANQITGDATGTSPKDVRLKGAEFTVYAVNSSYNPTGDDIATYTSSARGTFDITYDSMKYKYDTVYALKETKAPDGFQLSETVMRFCFLSDGTSTLPAGAPEDTVKIPYKGSANADIPNDVGSTSIGAEKVWKNDKLEIDSKTDSVTVKIKQTATYDKAGKLVVPDDGDTKYTKYYPIDAATFNLNWNGQKWVIENNNNYTGVTITDGRVTGLPTMTFTDTGVPLYYQYTVEEVPVSGYNTSYSTTTSTEGTTVTITNIPSSVTSFAKVTAKKQWVDGDGKDITSEISANTSIQAKVYRATGVVKEGTIIESDGTRKSAGDLFPLIFQEADGHQGGGPIEISPVVVTALPDDEIKIVFNPTYKDSTQISSDDFEVQVGYIKPDGNYENSENKTVNIVDGHGEITITATSTTNVIRLRSKNAQMSRLDIVVTNLTAEGRTQVLTQAEAESVGGEVVETLTLNKANNWQATSAEYSGGSGNTVYTYYVVEENGANYDAQYSASGETVTITNVDKRLRVDKQWFMPDGTTPYDMQDGSITYELIQVVGVSEYQEGQYSGDGPYYVDISELLTGDVQNGNNYPGSITVTGDDKIRAGSNVKITIEANNGDSNSMSVYGDPYISYDPFIKYPFSVTGCESYFIGDVQYDSDYNNTKIKSREITVTNVTSTIKLKGYMELKGSATTVTINVEVLGEYVTSADTTERSVGTVTMTYDDANIVLNETFTESGITVSSGTDNWTSIISKLPSAGTSAEGAPETYTYKVVEKSFPNTFEYKSVDPDDAVPNSGSITISNKAKPAKVRVTKVFEGLKSSEIPYNFRITNNATSDVFTISNIAGGAGTSSSPYYWEINNLLIDQQVRFYESGVLVDGKELSVTVNGTAAELSSLSGTTTAVSTLPESVNGTDGTVHFVNSYGSQKGSLEITKIVKVDGQDLPTNQAEKATILSKLQGPYTFTIKDSDGNAITQGKVNGTAISNGQVQITVTDGKSNTVTVTDLEPGTYTIKEDTPTNGTTLTSGNDVQVTVVAGETIADGAKASFTNNLPTTSVTVNKTWLVGETDYSGKLSEMFGEVTVELGVVKVLNDATDEQIKAADIVEDVLGEEAKETLNAPTWTATISNLPELESGSGYKYAVKEIAVWHGNTNISSYFTTTLTNATTVNNAPVLTNVTVEKKWKPETPTDTTITLSLYKGKDAAEATDKVTEITLDGTADSSAASIEGTEAGTKQEQPSWTAEFKNLPKYAYNATDGIYEIQYVVKEESEPEGYTVSYGNDGSATYVITGGTITNTKNPGNLELTKKVSGDGADENKQFEFTIELTAPEGGTLADSYTVVKTTAAGNETAESKNLTWAVEEDETLTNQRGSFAVSLAHDEKITVKDLPAGAKYVITETDYSAEGYSPSTTSGSLNGTISGGTTEKESVIVTNTYEPGKLVINKELGGSAADTERDFQFEVVFDSGSSGNGPAGSYTVNGTETEFSFDKGKSTVTFTLKGGDQAQFSIKKKGTTFQVTEISADKDGYVTTVTASEGTKVTGKVVSGTISSSAAITVTYTNTKETKTVEATKVWKNGSDTIAWPEDVESVEFALFVKIGNDENEVAITDDSVKDYFNGIDPAIDPIKVISKDATDKKASWSDLPEKVITSPAVAANPDNNVEAKDAVWSAVTYSVKETKINYTASTGKTEETVDVPAVENIITNTPTTSIHVSKEWQDKDGHVLTTAPEDATVTFTLLANGNELSPSKTVELNGVDETKDAGSGQDVEPSSTDYEGANWTAYFTNLPVYDSEGKVITYTVQETGPWPGYVVVSSGEDITYPAEDGGKIINKESTLSLDILKVDKNNTVITTGATFELVQVNDTPQVDVVANSAHSETTGTDGTLTFSNLKVGFYRITEITPPPGYVLPSDATFYIEVTDTGINLLTRGEGKPSTWDKTKTSGGVVKTFTAKTDTANAKATVENTPGTALPQTGGIGTTLFTALGGFLTATAGAILTLRRKRKTA